MQPITRVLVPVDLEALCWEALDYAGWLAAQWAATTDVLYVEPLINGHVRALTSREHYDQMLTLIATLSQRFGGSSASDSPREKVLEPVFVGNMQPGKPAELILEFADLRDHDVIVLGSRPASSQRLGNGSVAEAVLRHARSPVMVVPAAQELESFDLRFSP